MTRIWTSLQTLRFTERGASLVEYALLVGLIAVVAVVAITAFGDNLSEAYSEIADTIP